MKDFYFQAEKKMPSYKNVSKLLKQSRKADTKNLSIEKETLKGLIKQRRNKSFLIEQLQFVKDKKKVIEEILSLKDAKKRANKMTGQKLKGIKKKVLIKLIKKRTELMQKGNSSHGFSWKVVIPSIYPNLSDEEKRHLSKDCPIRLTDNQIHSIAQTIRYHQERGNLPLK